MNRSDYLQQVYDAARAMGLSDVAARVAATQSALETSYGTRAPGNNYFGIKGQGQTLPTQEGGNGNLAPTKASFRTYNSMQDSVADWANQMQTNWPGVLTASTYPDAINSLNNGRLGPYSTDGVERNDPMTYQDKLSSIGRKYLPVTPVPQFVTMAKANIAAANPPPPLPRPRPNPSSNTTSSVPVPPRGFSSWATQATTPSKPASQQNAPTNFLSTLMGRF